MTKEQESAVYYFLTFCIEQYKNHISKSGQYVKELFDKNGVTDYITQNYECLHTQGHQWLEEEIDSFLLERGVKIA